MLFVLHEPSRWGIARPKCTCHVGLARPKQVSSGFSAPPLRVSSGFSARGHGVLTHVTHDIHVRVQLTSVWLEQHSTGFGAAGIMSPGAPTADDGSHMVDFVLLKTTGALAPRLGRLSLGGRKPISTPAFLGNTSRGVVPHMSPDNFSKHAASNGVYVALEDCGWPWPASHCVRC